MLSSSVERISERLRDDDVVLDIGGWAKPFARADWVMDLMPYESRGLYGGDHRGEERFGPETWICRDICDRDPYPFEDDEIDFVICSHTLEDIRDPIWVCREMSRIAKAGYIEVPSRLEEQSHGIRGDWTGWGHHRWLIDIDEGRIEFVFKPGVVHEGDAYRFPNWFYSQLTEEERVQTLWWQGGFEYEERIFTEAVEVRRYLAEFVAGNLRGRRAPRPTARLEAPLRRLLRR